MKKSERIKHYRFLEQFIQENWDKIEFKLRLAKSESKYFNFNK